MFKLCFASALFLLIAIVSARAAQVDIDCSEFRRSGPQTWEPTSGQAHITIRGVLSRISRAVTPNTGSIDGVNVFNAIQAPCGPK
jgi:hypothetical protein